MLIDFINQPFQLPGPLLFLRQMFPLFGNVGGLLRFLQSLNKLGAVALGVVRNSFQNIGNQGHYHAGVDSVLCLAARSNGVPAVFGAVHEAGKRGDFSEAVGGASDFGPNSRHSVKSFLVDDGLMGVIENRLSAFIDIMAFLVLKVFTGLQVHCMV